MEITSKQVMDLRKSTGAGVMECKKALIETNGNKEAAIEYLTKKGRIKAGGKDSRIAAEGMSFIAQDRDTRAAVVEVNSETDFVAQNEMFRSFVAKVADQCLGSEAADIDAFLDEAWTEDPSKTVNEALADMIAVIKEKLSIRRFKKLEETEGCIVSYLHGGGRIGVLVDAKTAVVNDGVKEALRNVAMQVASMNPKFISKDDIPAEYVEREKEILLAQTTEENNALPEKQRKPQKILEKMLIGRLNKNFKEICLLEQTYVRAEDGKQTVGEYLEQVGKENGTRIIIKEIIRFETGEGIEKKKDNFVEEVIAQSGKKN